jgi:ABC-2 type transport system permease protein
MKAFTALMHRELLEHRGAFLTGPLLLLGIIFALVILAFTVGRVDVHLSGAVLTVVPLVVYELGFLGLGFGWSLYLAATLFFYAADGFAADKRNNAMLFWKSMPVSDFKVLLSKLAASVTLLPLTVFGVVLLSGVLLFTVAFVTMLINGTAGFAALGDIVVIYGQVALALFTVLLAGLLWYLPFIALVGAIATVVGRWAIPIALLLPTIISALEWVTLGGLHPFATRTWAFMEYRSAAPATNYADSWIASLGDRFEPNMSAARFDGFAFAGDLLGGLDWTQVGIGVVFALVVIYLASEYRRRVNDN